jgi:hypothetical protein
MSVLLSSLTCNGWKGLTFKSNFMWSIMVDRGMPRSADFFRVDFTVDCVTDVTTACFAPHYRSATSWTVFHTACCESAFFPPQHCCFPWWFNNKGVSKCHFHCLHGIAGVRSFMKSDCCHHPLLNGIRTMINSHVWNSTAQLPTPVTCHSIGTPLAGTQILPKYRGGAPTSRPPCTGQEWGAIASLPHTCSRCAESNKHRDNSAFFMTNFHWERIRYQKMLALCEPVALYEALGF